MTITSGASDEGGQRSKVRPGRVARAAMQGWALLAKGVDFSL